MANISKNIRRLRTGAKLTQEQLAERLNVTRQTVSSWETDRTQPDIDMLTALATALDTDVEDLIYGKRKHVGLEADPTDRRKTLSLVLVITGSLLFAVGLVFLFVYFWDKVPGVMKTALSLLPLLVGAGAGMLAVWGKNRGVAFTEGAAVLWIAGVTATNALINSLFSVDFGFENLLLADVLLLLPVPFLLNSVFAFTAETAMGLFLMQQGFDVYFADKNPWHLLLGAAVIAVLGARVLANAQPKPVKQYLAWLWLLAACAAAVILGVFATENDQSGDFEPFMLVVSMVWVFFTALYITGRGKRFDLHFTEPAAAVLAAGLPVLTAIAFADDDAGALFMHGWRGYAVLLPFAAVCLVPAFLAGVPSLKGNKLKIAFTALVSGVAAMLLIIGLGLPFLTLAFSIAAGVLVVVAGVRRGKLLVCNFGMLQIAANVFILLYDIGIKDLFWVGCVFVLTGAVFLVINRIMIKKFGARKAAAAAEADGDTPAAETEETGNA